MIIALPLEENMGEKSRISPHFGRSGYFAFVEVEGKEIKSFRIVENPFREHGVGDLPEFIKKQGAEMLIAYGMGERAIEFFNSYGIRVILGVEGNFLSAVRDFLSGKIEEDYSWRESPEFGHHD
ncbi:MAG: NifB/NifX family molybdenum-iron cluster-binding protein [Thermoplasmata archaeon]|jgi:predicted Fe-Mo cluster-binding NifX family protein|nr:dinitrogenase iron-molybdenum cofactor [Thermoplasmatales archaeon]